LCRQLTAEPDDSSDYFSLDNRWLSEEERAFAAKKEKERKERVCRTFPSVVMK
jgi:hypothetical protein